MGTKVGDVVGDAVGPIVGNEVEDIEHSAQIVIKVTTQSPQM